ncbi:MAG: methionyl-tRNA formyltransferase [Treponema sp.]|jgi:methionyl-tRNA formyltransferase|nr:methionyl-tRNA formyltransferase [Treponema sp.]
MRVLFAGSPGIAVPSLKAIAEGLCPAAELAGVLTNADSRKGRGGGAEPTEVGALAAVLAEEYRRRGKEFALFKPLKLDAAFREEAAACRFDLLVSFAYGRIFGPKVLALFPLGGINIHPSLLPRYRGPSPIPAVILEEGRETGITIQVLAAEMDSGDILAQERFPLTGRETTASLGEIAAAKAALMLPPLLKAIAEGTVKGRPQDHARATYCSLITREEGRIDWSLGVRKIDARIRAFTPWPLSWTDHGGQELCILEARPYERSAGPAGERAAPGTVLGVDTQWGILVQTGDGILAVERLQYRTKKALGWKDFLNGIRDFAGSRLGRDHEERRSAE